MANTIDTMNHLSAEDAAGFLDGRLPREVRASIEAHLAACRECRDDLGASARLLPASGVSWPIVRIVTGLAAAALITVAVRSATLPDSTPDRERAGPDTEAQLLAQSPADGAVIPAGHVVLNWSSVVPQSSYRVSVTDSLGSLVWSAESRDTTMPVPTTVKLVAGNAYFWYVEALLPDGRRRSSGVHRVRIQ